MTRLLPIAAGLLLAGCQTAQDRADADAGRQAEIAAKQGERVDQICFARNINGWRAFDRDTLLLERGVNNWYQVELSGTCEPEWAFNAIAVRSRPASSCISRGDQIETFDQPISGTCFITEIYEWNDDAEVRR